MIAPPSPSGIDDGASPMIAPTTLAVAATLKAEKRYGSADGTRSFQRTSQRLAAYECMSSSARGSADCRPRSVFTVTGKNVRYAAITATRSLLCRKQRRMPQQRDQQRPAGGRRLEELVQDVVQVRHRDVVDLERSRPARRDPERAVALPETPERREHQR